MHSILYVIPCVAVFADINIHAIKNLVMSTYPRISVIANFYNSEKFIAKLIRSVLGQTFADWELIAINDCSPGNDRAILEEYSNLPEMKGRMRVINNEQNQGISQAKSTGISAARGKFITFIDGDDWLEPHALQSMYDNALKHDADIVIANVFRTFKFGYRLRNVSHVNYGKIYTKDNIRKELIRGFCGINILSSYGYWGKLFKKSVIKASGYIPRKVAASEDLFFNLYNFLAADRIVFIDDYVYNWRWGGVSSSSTKRNEDSYGEVSSLTNYNNFYFEKKGIAEIGSNQEYMTYLKVELYNVMRVSFGSLCKYDVSSNKSSQIKKLIKDTINMPAYREILTIKGYPYFQEPAFFDALEQQDIDWLYQFFHDIYKKNLRYRIRRRILSLIS